LFFKNNSFQEDNERGMREFLDEMKRERQQLDRQRYEKEERERVLQLRRELLNYNFHECPRIKKEAFKDLEVDDTDLIRIALIGPTGSGKTSLVGKSACFYLHFFSLSSLCVCLAWLLRLTKIYNRMGNI